MSYLFQMLNYKQAVRKPRAKPYTRTSTNVRPPDSKVKYAALLTGKWMTAIQVAEAFGYTVEGVRATLGRYHAQKIVKRKKRKGVQGRPAFLYTWVS